MGIALQQAELFVQTQQQSIDLKRARDAAEAANLAKSRFLANMSHELRTPLNAILGFTQLLVYDPNTVPAQQEMLTIINRSSEHLLGLINDVLDMSKIEAGKVTLDKKDFDLHALLNTLDGIFQLKAIAKQLILMFERDPDVPQYVRTDEGKLRQVLTNLLSNAIKFTEVGKVTLRVRFVRGDAGERYKGDPAGPYFQLSNLHTIVIDVEDTGPGIAAEELGNLFNPFIQTESGRKSQQGTGLGLSISHRLVQLMGGEIKVSSALGSGTLFQVRLPVKLPTNEQESTQHPSQKQSQRPSQRIVGLISDHPSCRILIVDDAKTNRQILVKILKTVGFEIQEAENGQDAVTVWQQWQPHLVLMDVQMPIMDGYEATQKIRAMEQMENTFSLSHSTKIIALRRLAKIT